jgi:hypothetical protein
MKLSDTINNTTFFYVYSKNFKWFNPLDTEQFKGHPIPGNIYRASYNKDTRSYRLFVDTEPPMLIVLPSLKPVKEGYSGELIRITPFNIIDLRLKKEQLVQLNGWIKQDNEDIKRDLNMVPAKITKPDPTTLDENEAAEIKDFAEATSELYRIHSPMFNAIHEMIHYILDVPPGDSIDEMSLSMSEQFGAGLNVGKAFAALGRYVNDEPEVNLDGEDLLEAIYYLLYELSRRQTYTGEDPPTAPL